MANQANPTTLHVQPIQYSLQPAPLNVTATASANYPPLPNFPMVPNYYSYNGGNGGHGGQSNGGAGGAGIHGQGGNGGHGGSSNGGTGGSVTYSDVKKKPLKSKSMPPESGYTEDRIVNNVKIE